MGGPTPPPTDIPAAAASARRPPGAAGRWRGIARAPPLATAAALQPLLLMLLLLPSVGWMEVVRWVDRGKWGVVVEGGGASSFALYSRCAAKTEMLAPSSARWLKMLRRDAGFCWCPIPSSCASDGQCLQGPIGISNAGAVVGVDSFFSELTTESLGLYTP